MSKCPVGTIYDSIKKICEYVNNDNGKLDINDIMTISFQESIIDGSFNNVIKDVISEEKDYIISNEETMYQITTSNNQKIIQKNFSTIDLGGCEIILKEKYGIDMSIPLIIFKIDYFNPETLIPVIGYEVYHPLNNSKLDLSYCNNTVGLNIPVQIDEDKIYKYDPNSNYYKDECSSYTSDNGTDMLLYDRKKEYGDNKLSLCEANCNYQGYDINYKQSICDCNIKNKIEYKSEISNNPNVLSQAFNISEKDLGYTNIFACTKNLLTVNGILKNMSSYILIVSLLFFVATSFFFRRRGYRILVNLMNNIINDKITHHHKKKSKKLNKYKNINFKVNEKINFPPKKSGSRRASIFSVNNNNNNNFEGKKRKKRNRSTKEQCIKILNSSSKNNIDESANISMNNFPDCELNSLNYSEAVSYDNRTYFQYYKSLLKVKQPILFAFFPNGDYNSRLIKIGIFILSFNIHYATNFVYKRKNYT